MKTRLVLVGAPSLFREGLRALLGAVEEFPIAGEAPDMAEAVSTVDRYRADVLVIDSESMEAGWIERVPRLADHTIGPAPRVLLIISSEDGHLTRAATAGVTGWVLKEEETADLVAAIRAVSAGYAWLTPPVARQLLEHYRSDQSLSAEPDVAGADLLSARELGVLRLLAQGQSNAEIAEALVLGESTVKTHVSRMLAKLELRGRVQLTAFAYRNGLAK